MSEPNQSEPPSLPVPAESQTRPETAPRRLQAPKRPNARYVDKTVSPTGAVGYALKPAGYDLVATLGAEGNTEEAIATKLGMSPKTFSEIKKRDPALVAALQQGHGELGTELTHILLSAAREGNIVSAIYLSKARLGWRDQGPTDPNAVNTPTVNIQINAPLSPADFLKVVGPLPPEPEEVE